MGRLSLDFLGNSCFNSLIFFFRNLFSHLTIGWVPTQDIGIEDGTRHQATGNNLSKHLIVGPRDGRQQNIEEKAPSGMKKEAKIDGNQDAEKLELRF
jgi:hypothetical protein